MSLLHWIDDTARINRGKLKIWKKPDIPGIASATIRNNNNATATKKTYTGDLLAEVSLDMICNHLNKMFSGKTVCIPSQFMTEKKREELIRQLQIFHKNNYPDEHDKEMDEFDKKAFMLKITKNLAEGKETSSLASEILSSFSDKEFLEIAMLPENLTLESIFASRNLQESWTFIKLCDLIGKNPKKFAKQLQTQPKLKKSLIQEITGPMKELLICRTHSELNDQSLLKKYYEDGMLFEGQDMVVKTYEEKGTAGLSKLFPSHLGIIRHLVKAQMKEDQRTYSNFLEQIDKYQKGQIPKNKLPQLPSIDHHPTNIQAISIAKTSRNYLIKILKTHPDKNLLKMCQNKRYPKWYIVRKIIEADNQSRNTFVDIPEKGRDVLEWGNKNLPRKKPPAVTNKNVNGGFTPFLSDYWYEESFNRASILFDLMDKERLIFRRTTDKSLQDTLKKYNAEKAGLGSAEYEKRREIENEKKALIQESSTIGLPRSSMLSLIADYERLQVLKNLQQQAQTYSNKNPKRSPEQVAEHIIKAANKKNFFVGLNPKIYDQEKLVDLIAPFIKNSTDPTQNRKTSSTNTRSSFDKNLSRQKKGMQRQSMVQGPNEQLVANTAQHKQDMPSTKISNVSAKEFTDRTRRHSAPSIPRKSS